MSFVFYTNMSQRAAQALAQTLLESPLNTAGGVYYVIRYPKGWRFSPNKNDIDPELDHQGLWEELSYTLASRWSPELRQPKADLHAKLLPLYRAFPRGRVVVHGLRHFVRHGDNLEPFMGTTKTQIEAYYGLVTPEWNVDLHEQCDPEQKAKARALLGITEDWKPLEELLNAQT